MQKENLKEAWVFTKLALKLDYEACSGGLKAFHLSFLVHPGFQVSLFYRLARMFHVLGWMFVAKAICVLMRWLTHCDIHHGADIGPGVQFPHGCGVVIGEGVIVGPKCSLFQHTTMGAVEGMSGAPRLAEGVNLYPGTVIAGNVEVGEYCRVGPNVYLTESVPSHTRVSPPKPNVVRSDVSL